MLKDDSRTDLLLRTLRSFIAQKKPRCFEVGRYFLWIKRVKPDKSQLLRKQGKTSS